MWVNRIPREHTAVLITQLFDSVAEADSGVVENINNEVLTLIVAV